MRRRPITTDGAAERWRLQRFNPWQDVTPESLNRAFSEFDQGWLRRAALMWENRSDGDEVLAGVVPKRCSSVASLPWEIIAVDDSPRALEHQAALQNFFDRGITATDALDLDQEGGMRLLIEQAMDAVFLGKSVHEIIWRPGRLDIAAELRSVPLYFFEQLSGRLRYTGPEMTTTGQDLEPGGWMITTRRRKLLKACLMAAMFKGMALSDWISYSGRFGQPGVHGETDAEPGSPEWDKAEEMVLAFAAEWAALTRSGTKINLIEAGKNPNAPYEPMVERMSRVLSMLVRGADLGTLSSKDANGASLQDEESNLLLDDDAQMISEALQRRLARPVIRHLFGETPLAYIELQVPSDSDTKTEIEVDTALVGLGVNQDPADLAERYGRTIMVQTRPATAENDSFAAGDNEPALGSLAAVLRSVTTEDAKLRVYVAIRDVLTGDGDLAEGLAKVHRELPQMIGKQPAAELAFERYMAAALLEGWTEGGTDAERGMQIYAQGRSGDLPDIGADRTKSPANRTL